MKDGERITIYGGTLRDLIAEAFRDGANEELQGDELKEKAAQEYAADFVRRMVAD